MRYSAVTGPVKFSEVGHKMLDQLVASGLFGEDKAEAVQRIVEKFLWDNSEKPLLTIPKRKK